MPGSAAETLGNDQLQRFRDQLHIHGLCPKSFTVQVDDILPVELDGELRIAQVRDELRKVVRVSGSIFPDAAGEGKERDLLYNKNIQQTVVQHGSGGGVEAASVKAAVAGTDQGIFLVRIIAAAADTHPGGDAPDGVHDGGDHIGPGSADQRERGVAVDFGADAGVDPDRADVGAVAAVAGDEINFPDFTVEQGIQIPEERCIRPEHPAEVVPRPGGNGTDRDVRQKGGAADAFVEGSVSAAGIDTEGFSGGGFPTDFFGGVTGRFGDVEFPGIRAMVKGPLDPSAKIFGGIPASRDGVDNEQMLQVLFAFL